MCYYFDHFETELNEAAIPRQKWKKILIAKISPKVEESVSHLIARPLSTYDDLKTHLKIHIGPSIDELCNIIHGSLLTRKSRTRKK